MYPVLGYNSNKETTNCGLTLRITIKPASGEVFSVVPQFRIFSHPKYNCVLLEVLQFH